ncbi:ATP-binding protein [uncultured Roseovarius sp.]|uniref:sensor histidine kinase n=1 Tax=uncultured Roseovarius sp. TaxID=293344 RepID=UPI002621C13C|nr:ATP-binding protein [uncultured Roseovarius sp.]
MKNQQKVLNGISVPVMLLDNELRIALANNAAFASFPSLQTGESLGKLGELDRDIETLLQTTLARRGATSLTIVTNETFQREFLISVKTVTDLEQFAAPTLVLTFEDQTPLRIAKSMRSDFVANVSHEIRSPLTAISGFVETLQGDGKDDPEAGKLFLGLMEKEVARMTNLVSDLLSLSKVEAKESRAPKKPLNLNQTIHQAVESVTALARKRGKHLDCKVVPDLPTVLGKRDDLARALINLLENAINYSREGSTITVTAQAAPNGNPLNMPAVFVSVRDQGEGIPAREIPRLTERFYRIDKSRSRNVGGTGLGLAIVKHILVRHRGVLTINSTLGTGSTFTAYLPVAAPQQKK